MCGSLAQFLPQPPLRTKMSMPDAHIHKQPGDATYFVLCLNSICTKQTGGKNLYGVFGELKDWLFFITYVK